jgi:hypothetical protein
MMEVEAVIDATIISAQAGRDYPPWIHAPAKTKAVGEFLSSPLYPLTVKRLVELAGR